MEPGRLEFLPLRERRMILQGPQHVTVPYPRAVSSPKSGNKPSISLQVSNTLASSPITSWQIDGETVETVSDFIFWAPKSLQMVTAAMKLKDAYSLEEKL